MQYNDYELFYMINENEEVFLTMVDKYEPLFRKVSSYFVKKFSYIESDFDDIVQQCRIAFCYAIDRYDVNKDILFYTFLLACLKNNIFSYLRQGKNKSICYNYMDIDFYNNLDEFIDNGFNFDDYEFEVQLIYFKCSIDFLDAQIFELRYNGFSYSEISSLLDINKKKVDNVLVRVRKKLEKYFLFS